MTSRWGGAVSRVGSPGTRPHHRGLIPGLGVGGIGWTPCLGSGAPLSHSSCHLCPISHRSQGSSYFGAGWGELWVWGPPVGHGQSAAGQSGSGCLHMPPHELPPSTTHLPGLGVPLLWT